MKFKKIALIGAVLAGALAVSAVAHAAAGNTGEAAGQAPAGDNKVLVVYYSNTGRTAQVARDIAGATGGDLLKLQTEQPYTAADMDYTNSSSRVTKEHDNPALQDQVKLTNGKPANWAEYNTVFVGYPIWWGIAAWPVNQFFTENDFTGKTVIPFATAYSSGLGQSADLLKAKAGNRGTWLKGRCFTGSIDDSEVTSWVESLNL